MSALKHCLEVKHHDLTTVSPALSEAHPSGFGKLAALSFLEMSQQVHAPPGQCWAVTSGVCLGDRPGYEAGGRRVGRLREADGQTALLAQGSCVHPGLQDRADSGSLGSGVAWFLVGSSVLLRPLLLLAFWAVLPFLGPSGAYTSQALGLNASQPSIPQVISKHSLSRKHRSERHWHKDAGHLYTEFHAHEHVAHSFRSLWITSLLQVLG